MPLQAPLQPARTDSLTALAINLIAFPERNSAWQIEPQRMPAGMLFTVPVPEPASFTVNR